MFYTEEKIIILNKTRSSRDRYILIKSPMGCFGDPDYYPTYSYSVANGVDRGNGYQGYSNLTYFLKDEYSPLEAKHNLIVWLKRHGYKRYIKEESLSCCPVLT